jgi:predicted nucleotidyltransferase/HEPN domain-containing protein
MKTKFRNLSQDKIAYIEEVRDIIVSDMLKSNKGLVYVILFGSYARGNWVYEHGYDKDNGHNYSYVSDLDILIVTEKECSDHGKILTKIDRKLPKVIPFETEGHFPPVSMITHTIEHVNEMLEDNSYFFNDVKSEGVMLYDSGKYELASSKRFTPKERKQKAIDSYDKFFGKAEGFLEEALDSRAPSPSKIRRNIRAFMLHQACENAFVAANLVFADKRKKLHDLKKLEREAASSEPEFLHSFPKETKRDEEVYKLILKAYIDARYKESYKVSEEDLDEMAVMVKNFHILTERLCKKKINSFMENLI